MLPYTTFFGSNWGPPHFWGGSKIVRKCHARCESLAKGVRIRTFFAVFCPFSTNLSLRKACERLPFATFWETFATNQGVAGGFRFRLYLFFYGHVYFFWHFIHLGDTCWVFLMFLALSCYFLGTGVCFFCCCYGRNFLLRRHRCCKSNFPRCGLVCGGVTQCYGDTHCVVHGCLAGCWGNIKYFYSPVWMEVTRSPLFPLAC